MAADTAVAFEPRKTPVQARATVTVGAICEATIQVLLSHGADRLTTTRVADRAGVSVGTLYSTIQTSGHYCLRCSRIIWIRSRKQ